MSGRITLGSYIHVAAYSALYGGDQGILIEDFANISSRVSIYSISDDYSGETMTNPMVPEKYKHVTSEQVRIEKHSLIGSGSIVMPGVTIREGSSFGAFSFIKNDSNEWSINAGIPSKELKKRSMRALVLEQKLLEERGGLE
ncbi:dTDP-4-amino-4,6-dideoxy-D-glucose acyltransferase [compost metagenome]